MNSQYNSIFAALAPNKLCMLRFQRSTQLNTPDNLYTEFTDYVMQMCPDLRVGEGGWAAAHARPLLKVGGFCYV